MRRTLASTAFVVLALVFAAPATYAARVSEPKDFDRLDGHGPSTKKVDVIEWEGNLEIHVYPKGSLKSLGMKVDRESKSTKNAVMVIEYGFNGVPYTLIRRAVLSVTMPDFFHAFRDETAVDYDKIIVSGHLIAGAKKFDLAPTPTQLYPDFHPALAQDADEAASGTPAKNYPRPASDTPGIQFQKAEEVEQNARGTSRRRTGEPSSIDEDGGIRNFAF